MKKCPECQEPSNELIHHEGYGGKICAYCVEAMNEKQAADEYWREQELKAMEYDEGGWEAEATKEYYREMELDPTIFARGDQIMYIPDHANGDVHHKDVELGFITSMTPSGEAAFCRYFHKHNHFELRTTANSESTPLRCLRKITKYDQKFINRLLKEYCSES